MTAVRAGSTEGARVNAPATRGTRAGAAFPGPPYRRPVWGDDTAP